MEAAVRLQTPREPALELEPAISPRRTSVAAAKVYGFSALFLFLIFLPYLQVLMGPMNRLALHYDFSLVLQIYAVIGLLAVPLALGYGVLGWVSKYLPARIAPWVRRLCVVPFAAYGVTSAIYLIWSHLPWGDLDSAISLYHGVFKWLWAAIVLVFVASPVAFEKLATWGSKVLLVLSPLPVVLGFHLAGFPSLSHESPPFTPEPAAAAGELASGGPVYVFVFDEWDRVETFREGHEERFPHLAAVCRTSTTFTAASSIHDMTLFSIPSFLFQKEGEVQVNDQGETEFRDEAGQWTPASEFASFLTTLGETRSNKVIVGRCLLYDKMLGDEATWIYRLPWNSGHPLSLLESFRAHSYAAYFHSHFPLHIPFGLRNYELDYQARANDLVHEKTLDVIRRSGPDLVGLFHYLIPHNPYMYDAEGIRPGFEIKPGDVGYQDNLLYLDRVIGEIVRTIKATGTWEDCTLILTADHGTYRGHAQRQLEVPLIIKRPGQTAPRIIEDPIKLTRIIQWITN